MTPPTTFGRDSRHPSVFARYHRRVRRGRRPHLQALAMTVIVPLLMLLTRIRVNGRENIPAGGFIVTANHPSNVDAFMIAFALRRRVFYMGKSELFRGWRGSVFALLGGFPIRRGVWDMDAFDTAQALLDNGHSLAMFVEGGVSPEGGYRPAKSGLGYLAHRCGATVLPVHLDGSRKLYRPWTWPKVTVTIGVPFDVEQVDEPPREQCQNTSDKALAVIKSLDLKLETYAAAASGDDVVGALRAKIDDNPEEFAADLAAEWRRYFEEHREEFASDQAELARLLGEGASNEELAAWVLEHDAERSDAYRQMASDPEWQEARREARREAEEDGRL